MIFQRSKLRVDFPSAHNAINESRASFYRRYINATFNSDSKYISNFAVDTKTIVKSRYSSCAQYLYDMVIYTDTIDILLSTSTYYT